MFVNIAYFAAVSKEEILSSGQILAAVFFKNMFGKSAERAMSVFVALSAFGNVLSVLFSQGRSKLNRSFFSSRDETQQIINTDFILQLCRHSAVKAFSRSPKSGPAISLSTLLLQVFLSTISSPLSSCLLPHQEMPITSS